VGDLNMRKTAFVGGRYAMKIKKYAVNRIKRQKNNPENSRLLHIVLLN
jgi:hypothetical protein